MKPNVRMLTLHGSAAHGLLKKSLVVSQPMSDILFNGPANSVALTVLQPIPHYLKTELSLLATTVAAI